jgi:hypothetical protein
LAGTIPGPLVNDNITLCNVNQCIGLAGARGSATFYSGTIADGGTQLTATGAADATGGPAALHAFASYSMTQSSPFFTAFYSTAEYIDDITITSPGTNTGDLGYLLLSFQVTGTTTTVGSANAGIVWIDSAGISNPTFDLRSLTGNSAVTLNPVPFHFGDPLAVDYFLQAITRPDSSTLSGSADFSHTYSLTGVQVFDSGMNPISNPAYLSAAGLQYTANGAVPEATPFVLLSSGLLLVAVGLAFRRSHITPSALASTPAPYRVRP